MQTLIVIVIAGAAALAVYLLWIRPWYLRWGAIDAEVERAMPGDDEIKNPMHVTTHAVTIRARRGSVGLLVSLAEAPE